MKVKISANRVIVIAVVIFFIGIFYVLFSLLFSVPQQIYDVLGIEDFKVLDKISMVLREFSVVVIIEFILGVALVVYLLNQRNRNSESVIYVEKYADNQKNKNNGEENTTDTQEAILARIVAAADAETLREKKIKILFEALCQELHICVGAYYKATAGENAARCIELTYSYAYVFPDSEIKKYEFGEGISGQAAKSGKIFAVNNVPQGYISVFSGLGNASPSYIIAFPILSDEKVLAVLELATFKEFLEKDLDITKEVCKLIAEMY
jgi:hypothetical protein